MQVIDNKVVSIDYILRDKDGDIMDSSDGEALAFIQGMGQIIPGLESALIGKKIGDEFKVEIMPEEAYGEFDPNKKKRVPIEDLSSIEDLSVGIQLEGIDEEGNPIITTVVEINEDEAILDENHPLAGVSLFFEIKVLDIRDATKEELAHGHVHGAGGHHH